MSEKVCSVQASDVFRGAGVYAKGSLQRASSDVFRLLRVAVNLFRNIDISAIEAVELES